MAHDAKKSILAVMHALIDLLTAIPRELQGTPVHCYVVSSKVLAVEIMDNENLLLDLVKATSKYPWNVASNVIVSSLTEDAFNRSCAASIADYRFYMIIRAADRIGCTLDMYTPKPMYGDSGRSLVLDCCRIC